MLNDIEFPLQISYIMNLIVLLTIEHSNRTIWAPIMMITIQNIYRRICNANIMEHN